MSLWTPKLLHCAVRAECLLTSMILAPNLATVSRTVLLDHCATVKWITSSSGHSSPST